MYILARRINSLGPSHLGQHYKARGWPKESSQIWAISWQNQQSECAPSEDSDQPGHPPSLIRVFTVHMKKAWTLSYPLSAQRRLWSDWADAQADLSLRWAHSHIVGFYHEAAHLSPATIATQAASLPLQPANYVHYLPVTVENKWDISLIAIDRTDNAPLQIWVRKTQTKYEKWTKIDTKRVTLHKLINLTILGMKRPNRI